LLLCSPLLVRRTSWAARLNPSIAAHCHWCRHAQLGWIVRHDHVTGVLASLARPFAVVRVEPRGDEMSAARDRAAAGELDDDRRRRAEANGAVVPDVLINRGCGTRVVDVSVLHPLAPSYVKDWKADNVEREQRIIRMREKKKLHHYTKYTAAIRGGKTAPFVVDAFGAFGAEADQLLHWLGDGATSSHAFDTHADFMDTAYAWLSVAIQVGNAELADKVVARMRSSAIHRA